MTVTDGTNTRNICATLHSLVMLTFVGPRPMGFIIRHLDDDKTNNKLSNLRYGTYSENAIDAVKNKSNSKHISSEVLQQIFHMYYYEKLNAT